MASQSLINNRRKARLLCIGLASPSGPWGPRDMIDDDDDDARERVMRKLSQVRAKTFRTDGNCTLLRQLHTSC